MWGRGLSVSNTQITINKNAGGVTTYFSLAYKLTPKMTNKLDNY